MENFINSLQKSLLPFANKVSNNGFLSALGRTFQLLLPVIIIGSFACLGAFLDVPFWQSFVAATGLNTVFMTIQSVTLSLIALYVVIVFPYQYGEKLGVNPISASIISLITFLLVTPTELYTNIPMKWLGYAGLFGALIVGGLVTKLMQFMYTRKIYLRMPAGVPQIIEDAFASLAPALVAVVAAVVVSKLVALTSFENLHNVIYSLVQTPLQGFGLSLPAYLVMQIVCTLLMFTGIHGNTVFALFTPLTTAASAENLAALTAGQSLPNIITSSFSVLCQPGGIGGTFGLAFLLAFAARSKRLRMLGKMSIIPAIFGINEPLIFGIPILLNPLLFIPYVLNPIICTSLSYISIALGITPRLTGVEVNWTMPQFISGFIAQGWQTTVLQIVLVSLTTMIWFPFFKIVDRQTATEEKANEEAQGVVAVTAPSVAS